MNWKIHISFGFLSLLLSNLSAQCGFNHSLFARYQGAALSAIWTAEAMYGGEYVEMYLQQGVCYRMVVLDTAERAMQLQLFDRTGEQPLALTATPGGEAMVLAYRPSRNDTLLLALSQADCLRSWIPVRLVVERSDETAPCDQLIDRFWQTPTRLARYLFTNFP